MKAARRCRLAPPTPSSDYSPVRHHFFASPSPRVFAHRGGSALAPENTLAAFDNAITLGADGLELDVRLSRDGVVVVHHDAILDRTTPLRGPVAERTMSELARVDVPSLADVLARYGDVPIIIELKLDTADFAQSVLDVVRAARAAPRVCLGSFGRNALRAARLLEPAIATSASSEEVRSALIRSWLRSPVSDVPYDGYQIPESSGRVRVVSKRFVNDAHRAGLGVQVWTVDTVPDAQRLLSWGVDALITDRPDLIVPLVRSL